MFGSAYVAVVGYYDGDAGIYCRRCAEKMEEKEGVNIHGADWHTILRYEATENDYCGTCGEPLDD